MRQWRDELTIQISDRAVHFFENNRKKTPQILA